MNQKTNRAMFLLLMSFYLFFLIPLAPLLAQPSDLSLDMDLLAPVIHHIPSEEAIHSDTVLKLEAVVTDDTSIKEVTLFYRTTGEKKYRKTQMFSTGTDSYSIKLPEEAVLAPGFEYYIQAVDQGGNTTMRGFSSSPLRLTVSPMTSVKKEDAVRNKPVQKKIAPVEKQFSKTGGFTGFRTKTASTNEQRLRKPWYKKWWVWTLAVVVVGGAALSGGGGGGNSSAGATPSSTGSISVSGPIQ